MDEKDMDRSSHKEKVEQKRVNGRNIADKIMKSALVLIMTIVFVVLVTQLVNTPFFNMEIEGKLFSRVGVFGTTLLTIVAYIGGAIVGALLGYLISPLILGLVWKVIHFMESGLSDFSSQDLLIGTLGLLFGLIIANLIGLAFARLPIIGAYGPIVFSIIFGYAGMNIAIRKKSELIGLMEVFRISKSNRDKDHSKQDSFVGKLLDTSAIIDGRIAEICSTGFLEGPLLVPVFVLEELQLIADSSDMLKRNKGRRGLDILKQMQEDNFVEVRIINDDFDDVQGVDSKLVRLGRSIHAQIVTDDYNLNKVAALQGVVVLNINDLANALKPARIPGEEMDVLVVKAGKENNQGVGYLNDGTMIVVENGQQYIGSTVHCVVTSVLQTSAGRMIFVKIANE